MIFVNIPLLFFCPGIAFAGEYVGLRSVLAALLPFAPLLAFLFLIVGCVPAKETASSKAICRTGLLIVAFSLFAMAYCWDFGHNGVYTLYPELKAADVQDVEIYMGRPVEGELFRAELDAADTAELLALLPQVTCQNPHVGYKKILTEIIPEGQPSRQFWIKRNDGTGFCLSAFPPYYVVGDEKVRQAADKEVCQQVADLYAELQAKYAAAGMELAAADQ